MTADTPNANAQAMDPNVAGLILNAMSMRAQLLRQFSLTRRDIDWECDYPLEVTVDLYRKLFDREPIATRVVELMPEECWQVSPDVYESEDDGEVTEFEVAIDEMQMGLRGDSWYQDSEGSPIWECLHRADILSGIGHYGVILLGLDDVKEGGSLQDPVKKAAGRKLLYLRAFDESIAGVTKFENDKTSPRYGMPTEYLLTLEDPINTQDGGPTPPTLTTISAHWTRIIHIAETTTSSSAVLAVPRMRPVLNRILDLRKLYSGSAEMYWQGAFPGLSLESNPQLGGDVEVDIASLRQQMTDYQQGLQRWLLNLGLTAKTLSPQVVDPTSQINAQLQGICIKLGVPLRIFMGSERGELASSQDDQTWTDRVKGRQKRYLTPRVVVPFFDRLIKLGVLPEPKQFRVRWPDLHAMSEAAKTQVAVQKVAAMAQYIAGNVEAMMTPVSFLTRIMDFDQDEAETILEEAEKAAEEKELEQLEEQQKALEQQQAMGGGLPPGMIPGAGGPPAIPGAEGPAPGLEEEEEEEEGEGPPPFGGKGKAFGKGGNGKPKGRFSFNRLSLNDGDGCGIGSGGFQPGNTCAKGGRGGGSSSKMGPKRNKKVPKQQKASARAARAKAAYNPSTKEKQDYAEEFEVKVASELRGEKSGDNKPADVVITSDDGTEHGVEVKSIHDAKDHRINMRRDSRERKEKWRSEKKGRQGWIVGIDNRDKFQDGAHADKYSGHSIYVYQGYGAPTLGAMMKVRSLREARQVITGKKPYTGKKDAWSKSKGK